MAVHLMLGLLHFQSTRVGSLKRVLVSTFQSLEGALSDGIIIMLKSQLWNGT